jgi:hypothetical protein
MKITGKQNSISPDGGSHRRSSALTAPVIQQTSAGAGFSAHVEDHQTTALTAPMPAHQRLNQPPSSVAFAYRYDVLGFYDVLGLCLSLAALWDDLGFTVNLSAGDMVIISLCTPVSVTARGGRSWL